MPKSKSIQYQIILIVICMISNSSLFVASAGTCPQGRFKNIGEWNNCSCPEGYKKESSGFFGSHTKCNECKEKYQNRDSLKNLSTPQIPSTGKCKIEIVNCTVSGTGGESMTWKGKLLKATGTVGREEFDTLINWPNAVSGQMNCATYTGEIAGLKAGTWSIETQVSMNSPTKCDYRVENGVTSMMRVLVGKNTCEPDTEKYLSYADLTMESFENAADPYNFRLVIYPGKSLFGNVIENSISVKVNVNGVTHYMHNSSSSRWAYTIEEKCPTLVPIDPQKKWQFGFEYYFLIDFDIKTDQDKNEHITQRYPRVQNSHSLVTHAGTVYLTSANNILALSEVTFGIDSLSNGNPCIPTWKHTENMEKDKPMNKSYEYQFEINNLFVKTQISRIEMAPYQESPANSKFEIRATLPVTLECGDHYKFNVIYKPGITDGWSKLAQSAMIKTWIIDSKSHESEGPYLLIDYSLQRKQD